MSTQARWENLRKRGRRLEQEVYRRLGEYSSQASRLGASWSRSGPHDEDEEQFERLQNEILSLLGKMQEVAELMAESLPEEEQRHPKAEQMALAHRRYLDILQDYTQEFRRTQSSLQARRDHAQLLAGRKTSRDGGDETEMSSLLQEKDTIQSSINMVDDLIAQSEATRGALAQQRTLFGSTQQQLAAMRRRLPNAGELVRLIQRHKKRDMIVLAIVIACCMFFLIIYKIG